MNKNIFVVISDQALMQMLHASLEAYTVPHRVKKYNRKYVETYCLLWGNCSKFTFKKSDKYIYTVDFVSVETSAERSHRFVEPKDESLLLKMDLMTSFWPQYRFIGDFHTHPYKGDKISYKEIEKEKKYDFSTDDFKFIEDYPETWIQYDYRIGLVMTIVYMKRKSNKRPEKINNNLICFNFSNYRFWLKSYYADINDSQNEIKLTEDIELVVPSLLGLHEFSRFGRHFDGLHEEGEV